MRTSHRFATAAAAAGLAATLVVPTAGAAAPHCTAWGSLPARVSLHSSEVVVRPVLTGTADCHGQRTDNGATATLYPPKGTPEDMRWRTFGSAETVKFYAGLARPGRYTMRDGDVQVYGSDYRQVDSSWRSTSMVVKYAARFRHVTAARGLVTGQEQHYTRDGWKRYARKTVSVQRRAVGATAWHTLKRVRANARGVVAYRTATTSHYEYRLASGSTSTVWSAHSSSVRG